MRGERLADNELTSLAGRQVTKLKKFFDATNCEAREISSIYFLRSRYERSRGLKNFGIFVVANVVVKNSSRSFTRAI